MISCLLASTSALGKLTELYKWSSLDYTFASDAHKSYALERGEFVPENNLPVGIEVWKNKLFVTVPRWSNGNVKQLYLAIFSAERVILIKTFRGGEHELKMLDFNNIIAKRWTYYYEYTIIPRNRYNMLQTDFNGMALFPGR